MDYLEELKKDIKGEQNTLNEINFWLNGNIHTFYYKVITGAEYDKIRTASKTTITSKREDGNLEEVHYVDEDKLRVNIILEKSCDKEGNKLFSITNPEHKKLISNLAFDKQAYIAYQMGFKGMAEIIAEQEELLKKI